MSNIPIISLFPSLRKIIGAEAIQLISKVKKDQTEDLDLITEEPVNKIETV